MNFISLLNREIFSLFLHLKPASAKDGDHALELISDGMPCVLLLDTAHISQELLQEAEERNGLCRTVLCIEEPSFISSAQQEYPGLAGIFLYNGRQTVRSSQAELMRDILSSEYVNDLIYGHPERLSGLSPVLNIMRLRLTPQIVFTMVLDDFWTICENRDNVYRYRLKRIFLNNVRRTLDKEHHAIAATLTGTDKVVVLLDCRERTGKEAEEYAMQCAGDLLKEVKRLTGFSVSIGMSDYCPALPLLCRSYEQSFRALEQSFQAGTGQILRYRGPGDGGSGGENGRGKQGLQPLSEQVKRDLIIAITSRDAEMCRDTLDSLSAGLSIHNADAYYIKSLFISILSEMAGYCVSMGLDAVEASGKILAVTSAVFKSNTMVDVKLEANRFLKDLLRRLKPEAPESTPLDMAVAYMELYCASSPGLGEVSQLCGYSPSYFSRTFKEHFGINFARYSRNIRVKQAKKLLQESDLSLPEIADKTGFRTLSYFSFVFKKETGLSPGQYRTLLKE